MPVTNPGVDGSLSNNELVSTVSDDNGKVLKPQFSVPDNPKGDFFVDAVFIPPREGVMPLRTFSALPSSVPHQDQGYEGDQVEEMLADDEGDFFAGTPKIGGLPLNQYEHVGKNGSVSSVPHYFASGFQGSSVFDNSGLPPLGGGNYIGYGTYPGASQVPTTTTTTTSSSSVPVGSGEYGFGETYDEIPDDYDFLTDSNSGSHGDANAHTGLSTGSPVSSSPDKSSLSGDEAQFNEQLTAWHKTKNRAVDDLLGSFDKGRDLSDEDRAERWNKFVCDAEQDFVSKFGNTSAFFPAEVQCVSELSSVEEVEEEIFSLEL